jgi:hypothetical protein
MKKITGFDSFEQNLKAEREQEEKKNVRIGYAILGGLGLAVALGVNALRSPQVAPTVTEVTPVESSRPAKPPVEGAEWSDYEQSWLCPAGEFSYVTMNYTGWVNCTAENYPTEQTREEEEKDNEIRRCASRSGKQYKLEGAVTAGWQWAMDQCRENPDAF